MQLYRGGTASVALALTLLTSTGASAAEIDQGRRLLLGGFGTVGGLYHNERGLEYRRHAGQPRGAEAGEIDFAVDSLAGLQLNAAWNVHIEAVAQILTRLDADNSWRPRLTRGFLRYRPFEEAQVSVGRLGLEVLPLLDSRDIGYSYLTIRPPVEVLGLNPRDDFDGANVLVTRPVGNGIARFKLYGGRYSGHFVSVDGPAEFESSIWGGHAEYLRVPWGLRLGYGTLVPDDAPQTDALANGLRQTGSPDAINLADDFADNDRHIRFLIFGVTLEHPILQGRLALIRTHSDHITGPKTRSGFITLGYALAKFTPYVSISAILPDDHPRATGLPDVPQLAPLNTGARIAQTAAQADQTTYSLGVRYDFAPRMDFKLQIDRVFLDGTNNANTVFNSNAPGGSEADMTVLGLAFDFIF